MAIACSRCEKLPEFFSAPAILHIAPPLADTGERLDSELRAAGRGLASWTRGIISVHFNADDVAELVDILERVLSSVELDDCRALAMDASETPSILDLMNTQALSGFVGRVRGRWLSELVRRGGLFSLFQPIVSASNPQSIYGYECLLRGREEDGKFVFPDRIFGVAKSAELLHLVDREARLAAIKGASEHRLTTQVFINFLPTAIYDPNYCLRSTMAAIERSGLRPENIVFEVVESEFIVDTSHLAQILNFYREHKFRVALDDLGAGYGSLNLLTAIRPDFVKLNAELIRGADEDPYRARISERLLDLARELGVKTIVEGVETEGELKWVQQHSADYVQGYVIAKPATPPPKSSFSTSQADVAVA